MVKINLIKHLTFTACAFLHESNVSSVLCGSHPCELAGVPLGFVISSVVMTDGVLSNRERKRNQFT